MQGGDAKSWIMKVPYSPPLARTAMLLHDGSHGRTIDCFCIVNGNLSFNAVSLEEGKHLMIQCVMDKTMNKSAETSGWFKRSCFESMAYPHPDECKRAREKMDAGYPELWEALKVSRSLFYFPLCCLDLSLLLFLSPPRWSRISSSSTT